MSGPFGVAPAGAVLLVLLFLLFALLLRFPPINDVTTTPDDPPAFRADPPGDVRYPPPYSGLQRRAYPDVAPLFERAPVDVMFRRARAAAREMPGWAVVFESDSLATVQAVAATRFFRFQEDVVVEVRPARGGSEVHVRSRSRIGRTDLGTNARRIRAFLERLG